MTKKQIIKKILVKDDKQIKVDKFIAKGFLEEFGKPKSSKKTWRTVCITVEQKIYQQFKDLVQSAGLTVNKALNEFMLKLIKEYSK